MLFGIVYIAHLTNLTNKRPLRLLSTGKFKIEKRPWTEEKNQTSPKKKKGHISVLERKQKHLSESDQGSLSFLPELSLRVDSLSCSSVHLLALLVLPRIAVLPLATSM